MPLSYRRNYLDLSFLMNVIMYLNCIDFSEFFQFLPSNRTRDDLSLIRVGQTIKHDFYYNFFFNRCVNLWNAVEYETREALLDCETKSQIKSILNEFIFQMVHEKFSSDLKCTWSIICTCTNCQLT